MKFYDKNGNVTNLLNFKLIETNLSVKEIITDDIFMNSLLTVAYANDITNQLYTGIVTGLYDGSFVPIDQSNGLAVQIANKKFTYNGNKKNDSSLKITRIVVFY